MDRQEFIDRMCTNKIRYRTLRTAKNALSAIKKSGYLMSHNFRPYKCPHCNGGYHLGHSKMKVPALI